MFAGLRKKWRDQIGQTKTILGEKVREALASVVPITLIVLILCFTAAPVPTDVLLAFLVGAVLLIVGMGLFTLGADTAMLPIGERVGAQMTKSRKLWVVVCVSLLIGIIVTISEPDLQVLAGQVPGIPNAVLIGAVAVGVGIFLVIALLRILFQIPLNGLLIASYIVIFTLAAFAPKDFLAVAFDSGGVTTGPMTVPFIMALGVGVSAIRSDRHAADDSFGLVAMCSIGPILAVLILGIAFRASDSTYIPPVLPEVSDSVELWQLFHEGLPEYIKEIASSLLPIVVMFGVFQAVALRLDKRTLGRIAVGLAYTYVGLVLFLTGANVGFMPAGNYLGQVLTGQTALTETEKQPAHGARTRWALRVGKKRINFYQNSGISDAECDKIIYEYPFAIRGVFTLPFSLVRERVQPYRTADAPVSEDAARASLEQALLQQLRETIGADGAIISYETAAETTGNVLTVTLTAECEQEIGRAQATPDAEFLQLRPPAGEGTTADD